MLFCGCTHKIAGNFPYSAYIDLAETENGFLVPFYEIDVRNRLCTDTGNDLSQSETVLYGGTAPLYSIVAPQGYESVEAHITACELERSSSVVDTCGYVSDGKLFGFVNVYYDTVGYLAGGGNYGVEEISHGIILNIFPKPMNLRKSSVSTTATLWPITAIRFCIGKAENTILMI